MPTSPLGFRSLARVAIVIFLAVILVSEALIYSPPVNGRLTVNVEMDVANGRVSGNDTVHSPVAANARQSIYLIHQFPRVSTVYLYFDASYPWSYSNLVDWYGLSTQIVTVSEFRGAAINVIVLDAAQLPGFLNTTPTLGEVLIVASGVLPDTVFTKSTNLVTPWVEGGGTLVWIGDKIGGYSGMPGVPLKYPSPFNPGNNGTRQFLNLTLLGGSSQYYNQSSSLATAFDLNYTLGLANDDLNVTLVPTFNGTLLGNLNGSFTNLASVPLGSGRLLYFGGPTEDAANLGLILTNLFETGLITDQVSLVDSTTFDLTAGASVVLPFTFALPYPPSGGGPTLVCSFFTQTNYLALFGQTSCVNEP
jgi:hypothetical protein